MLDEVLAVLWHNPSVYVELGHLQVAISRKEYYAYLKRIVDAGYGNRVMFGSDVGLDDFGKGIQAIQEAEFLTEDQKRDILYNNAVRFLRLPR
jgi:predicted TIM-barrel fold metal-dependent hydrolase